MHNPIFDNGEWQNGPRLVVGVVAWMRETSDHCASKTAIQIICDRAEIWAYIYKNASFVSVNLGPKQSLDITLQMIAAILLRSLVPLQGPFDFILEQREVLRDTEQ